MDALTTNDLKAVFAAIAGLMNSNRDYLIQLDSATGDGDLGLTMSQGFAKVNEAVQASEEPDVGKLIQSAGMVMAQAVPSTMGTLMATGMMRGGKALIGRREMQLPDFAEMLDAFTNGVMARGKAQPGERTLIDSLYPAVLAAREGGNTPLTKGLQSALAAARGGVEATKTMKPAHGRAVYHQEAATLQPDQGAVVGMLFVQGFADVAAK